MANFGNFNARQRVRVVENDADIVSLGTYKPPQDSLLQNCYVYYYIKGVSSITNETMILRFHTSDNLNRVYAASSSIKMSAMFTGSTNFIGRVRFDFSDVPIDANTTYYLSIATTNYARNADIFYFSFLKDFPFTTNSNGSAETAETPLDYAYKFEVFGEV